MLAPNLPRSMSSNHHLGRRDKEPEAKRPPALIPWFRIQVAVQQRLGWRRIGSTAGKRGSPTPRTQAPTRAKKMTQGLSR